jgi:glutamine amidotransferase
MTLNTTIAIIDYGSGNLRSAAKAFDLVAGNEMTVIVTSDPKDIAKASHIVLPGVGAYGTCMAGLTALDGMIDELNTQVIKGGKPFLGICVGMQLMASLGEEHGEHKGLNWISCRVVHIEPDDKDLKIPHMGWNKLSVTKTHPLLSHVDDDSYVYFVHSYQFKLDHVEHQLGVCDYGGEINAVIGRDNMVGLQFHPEKSQATGLGILKNFIKWKP